MIGCVEIYNKCAQAYFSNIYWRRPNSYSPFQLTIHTLHVRFTYLIISASWYSGKLRSYLIMRSSSCVRKPDGNITADSHSEFSNIKLAQHPVKHLKGLCFSHKRWNSSSLSDYNARKCHISLPAWGRRIFAKMAKTKSPGCPVLGYNLRHQIFRLLV